MAEELFIPQLGQTVEEVTLISLYAKDGEYVKQGQEVLEVETDKAVFDVEATGDGYIHYGPYKVGDIVPVLTVVAIIGEKEEKFKAEKSTPTPTEEKKKAAMPATEKVENVEGQKYGKNKKIFSSPRARKLAAEMKVDLSKITATRSSSARITEKDVKRYLDQIGKGSMVNTEIAERIPLQGTRSVVAKRMATSAQETARVTLFMDADATALIALREKLIADKEKEWGFKPGYNDLLIHYSAKALKHYPYMNARLNGDVIERLSRVHIGIAVDDERGLYVPVIKNADQKNLQTIGKELRGYVEMVRSRKIAPDDLQGGTFTITNLGMYDVDGFTPVINLPEAAILGIGRISKQAVVVEGKIAVRDMMTLSLVFDHRLVDGAPAARFLQHLKNLIEDAEEETAVG
ncbi:MAG: 2-oxo acid dehydrogenase subunit E2 [Anaerolineaceae bacterium]|nr:2-oxo acid dehydrogenase subunit E2 [Anaerolineaceae bacterium]